MDLDETIAALRSEAPATGIFLDFDGTLAPVVPDPGAARIAAGGAQVLTALAARFGLVAMISGRDAADLRARVGVDGPRYLGLYGAEEIQAAGLVQAPMAERWRASALRLADGAHRFIEENDLQGCAVEYKDLAVSIHYRQSPQQEPPPMLYEWAKAQGAEVGFRLGVGRKVLELKPQSVSKAAALERLADQMQVRNAVVAGDDSADLEMMQRARRVIHGHLLRIGIASSELPEGLEEHTEIMVASPEELIDLLKRLI